MKTVKKRSQLQEKAVARELNAKTVVASGALWSAKGDVRNENFLIECKTTEKDFYSVTAHVWFKIEEEAVRDRVRTPLLVVDLKDFERYVIFNPKSFNCQVQDYEITEYRVGCKSFRFKGYSSSDLPITFILEKPVGRTTKRCTLMAMKIDEFMEVFKEELQ